MMEAKMIVADYEAIELRVMFGVKEEDLKKVGGDLYQAIADKNNISRDKAKEEVFYVAYGKR